MYETSPYLFFKLTKAEVVFRIKIFTGLYSSYTLNHMQSSGFFNTI